MTLRFDHADTARYKPTKAELPHYFAEFTRTRGGRVQWGVTRTSERVVFDGFGHSRDGVRTETIRGEAADEAAATAEMWRAITAREAAMMWPVAGWESTP